MESLEDIIAELRHLAAFSTGKKSENAEKLAERLETAYTEHRDTLEAIQNECVELQEKYDALVGIVPQVYGELRVMP